MTCLGMPLKAIPEDVKVHWTLDDEGFIWPHLLDGCVSPSHRGKNVAEGYLFLDWFAIPQASRFDHDDTMMLSQQLLQRNVSVAGTCWDCSARLTILELKWIKHPISSRRSSFLYFLGFNRIDTYFHKKWKMLSKSVFACPLATQCVWNLPWIYIDHYPRVSI